MTQLLISVKNVEEALIALNCGVDIIDLKDPNIGALGALNLDTSQQILQKVHEYKQLILKKITPMTSATVGEAHANVQALIKEMDARIDMGVDIIKISASSLWNESDSSINTEITSHIVASNQVRFIAVFFADQSIDYDLLEKLSDYGFYGAMIDTSKKQSNLLEICTLSTLQMFTQICQKNDLKSGLAGSLKPQHVEQLVHINPSYIGFRGGVCEDDSRVSRLMQQKIVNIRNVLQ